MKEVVIDLTKLTISVEVVSQSMHALGFDIVVSDKEDHIIDQLKGTTRVSSRWKSNLKLIPEDVKEIYVSGIFNFKSPDGSDYPYKACFRILVDDKPIDSEITLSGMTVKGNATTTEVFHIS